MSNEPGVSVYLTAAEVQALADADGYLSNIVEQCTGELPPDLVSARAGLDSLWTKARQAQGRAQRAKVKRTALRLADQLLAGE